MVEMHNGCICCTLRGDLLKTVKSLSEEGKFDYLVIESTGNSRSHAISCAMAPKLILFFSSSLLLIGIGEPMPVAQTFAMDVDSMEEGVQKQHKDDEEATAEISSTDEIIPDGTLRMATDEKKSLFHYAKLDTLVTVVDALNIYEVLGSIETLADENNISGMAGNSDGTIDEKQRETAHATASGLDVAHLRRLLKSRNLDTKGKKKDLVERLVNSFEAEMKEENKDARPISRLWLDQM